MIPYFMLYKVQFIMLHVLLDGKVTLSGMVLHHVCVILIIQTYYVTCSGETGNKSEQQVSHKVKNQQCRLFLSNTITQGIPIYKMLNSLSITKAFLDYYKRSHS